MTVQILVFFDIKTVNAGMPFIEGNPSLRGHIYMTAVDKRDGEIAADQTCFPWLTYHCFFPIWRIIALNRDSYCF